MKLRTTPALPLALLFTACTSGAPGPTAAPRSTPTWSVAQKQEMDDFLNELASEARSDFLVFDAQAMDKGPIARAKMPRRVPLGFHGNWVGA